MTKFLQTVGLERTYINIISAIYKKPTVNIILNRESSEAIPLKSRMRQSCPLSPLLFKLVPEASAGAVRQGKEI